MAEGGFGPVTNRRPKIQQLCRYFIHGACHNGDNCRYVHDRSGTVPSNNVCKFYQQGRCTYGRVCRYDHVRSSHVDDQDVNPYNRNNGQQRRSSPELSDTRANGIARRTRSQAKNDLSLESSKTRAHNIARQTRSQVRNDSSPEPSSSQANGFDRWTRSRAQNGISPEPSNTHDIGFSRRTRSQAQSENNWESSLVTLKKGNGCNKEIERAADKNQSSGDSNTSRVFRKNWAKAKDFVPGQKYHAGATYANRTRDQDEGGDVRRQPIAGQSKETLEEDLLCPYFAHGHCPYGDKCTYIHGEICDICQMPRLHPTDMAQREEHSTECLKEMEKDMEHSFAIQESLKKECCICLEIVLEKTDKEPGGASKKASKSNQFGILENCAHCFCLDCIRRWRSDKMSFGKNVRVCPICRVHSDFVTPSSVWVEEEAAKKKVIKDYKDALRLKDCQYFKQGKGECPFNEKCFYKHAYPDGTIAEPKPRPKRRHQMNSNGELNAMESMTLWDFLEVREDGLISLEDELSLYLLGLLGDSDDDSDDDFWLLRGAFSGGDSSDSDDDF